MSQERQNDGSRMMKRERNDRKMEDRKIIAITLPRTSTSAFFCLPFFCQSDLVLAPPHHSAAVILPYFFFRLDFRFSGRSTAASSCARKKA